MSPEQLDIYISQMVDAAAEDIFTKAHGAAMTTSGDITPQQQEELDEIKRNLKQLVSTQVNQNLAAPEEAAEEMKEWNVPVMRTGYGHALIAVSARTEQEAIDLAIDAAGGESFSEKSSEYEAPDGAHLIS